MPKMVYFLLPYPKFISVDIHKGVDLSLRYYEISKVDMLMVVVLRVESQREAAGWRAEICSERLREQMGS